MKCPKCGEGIVEAELPQPGQPPVLVCTGCGFRGTPRPLERPAIEPAQLAKVFAFMYRDMITPHFNIVQELGVVGFSVQIVAGAEVGQLLTLEAQRDAVNQAARGLAARLRFWADKLEVAGAEVGS